MEQFVNFASGKQGRLIRVLVGATLVAIGIIVAHNTAQIIVIAAGSVLVLSGLLKLCVLNKLVGRPITACPN